MLFWMNKVIRIRIGHGTLWVSILNSYLVLNHDDVIWDCPKMGILGKGFHF